MHLTPPPSYVIISHPPSARTVSATPAMARRFRRWATSSTSTSSRLGGAAPAGLYLCITLGLYLHIDARRCPRRGSSAGATSAWRRRLAGCGAVGEVEDTQSPVSMTCLRVCCCCGWSIGRLELHYCGEFCEGAARGPVSWSHPGDDMEIRPRRADGRRYADKATTSRRTRPTRAAWWGSAWRRWRRTDPSFLTYVRETIRR